MEYLHESSMPASKSELQVFSIPPTQTAIESSYEVEYRPSASLESNNFYEINIPASEDFTDLAATMLHIHLIVTSKDNKPLTETSKIKAVQNFGNALFEQVDVAIGSVNTVQANNTYHYQAYLEDLFFRHPNQVDSGFHVSEERLQSSVDLYFRLHSPLCEQDKLLINGLPLSFRFTKSPDGFALIKTDAADTNNYKIKFDHFALHIKRVKLFPEAQKSIITGLEKSPAKYFITRNDVKCFSIPSGQSSASFENVYNGVIPRRIIIGLVKDAAQEESIYLDPFQFRHFNANFVSFTVDGVMIPSIPYTPNHKLKLYMREFINLYRCFNQDEGIPQLNIKYEDYPSNFALYAFDLSPDGSIGAETGTLSLIKRGNIRLDIKFAEKLGSSVKVVVFGQFDNLITIDKERNVTLDY
ncbi:uncharacterized protein LOC128387418 [Panonychus citri]|uniref:uncharacterized protein LOC128387418 n=1 Tax=Panonychus citri TaxID=50023 RepID=UPI002307655E|nr:uncharacterized protein LOC128387418 [Panonychus citri]